MTRLLLIQNLEVVDLVEAEKEMKEIVEMVEAEMEETVEMVEMAVWERAMIDSHQELKIWYLELKVHLMVSSVSSLIKID